MSEKPYIAQVTASGAQTDALSVPDGQAAKSMLPSPSVEVESRATADGIATGDGQEGGQPVANLSGSMSALQLKRKRPSGAQRKQMRKAAQQSADSGGASDNSGGAAVNQSADPGVNQSIPRGAAAAKRKREKGETPDPVKRLKTYKTAANRALQAAIVIDGDTERPVSKDMAEVLRTELVKAMDAALLDGPPLRFEQSGVVQGSFRVSCGDQESLNWLKKTVPTIPKQEGIGFQCLPVSELQKLQNLKKATVWIPGKPSKPTQVLDRLAKQNPGLETDKWRIFHAGSKEGSSGQLLVLGLTEPSLVVLERLEFRPYFELSRLTFEVHTGKAQGGGL